MKRHTIEHFWNQDRFPFHMAPHTIKPGTVIHPHSHEFVELVYVHEGRAVHQHRGQESEIQEGDVFIIEPDSIHSYSVQPDAAPVKVYNLLFQPTLLTHELKAMMQYSSFVGFFFFEPFLRQHSGLHYYLQLKSLVKIEVEMILRRIQEEYAGKKIGYQIRVKAQLIDLLVLLSRSYEKKEVSLAQGKYSDEEIIQQICHFIEKYSAQDLTLEQISKLSGMSQSSFVSKFKKYTGQTMVEYRNNIRIKISQNLLKQTKLSITEIALEVGFHNFSHFNKMFKHKTGCSPKAFRNTTS
jgi:AraC-like DNA-binding protein